MKIKKLLAEQEKQGVVHKRLNAKKDQLGWKPPKAGDDPIKDIVSKMTEGDEAKKDLKDDAQSENKSVAMSAQKSHKSTKSTVAEINYELEVPEPEEGQFLNPLWEAYKTIYKDQLKYLTLANEDVDDYLEDLLQINEGGHKVKIKGYRAAFDVVEGKREKSKYKFNPNVYEGVKDLSADEIKMRVV